MRRYNFRETSLIATLYTQRFGKIRGIFKGFYTAKKEFASSLDIFSLNEFVFYPKKSEIWLMSHADLVSDYFFLRKSEPKAKVAALFFNLIDKLMQMWDSNSQVFSLAGECLSSLSSERELKVLYIFLIKFLTFSGFKPEFNHCINCKNTLNEEILFSISRGGFICKNCQGLTRDTQKISRQVSQSLIYIQKSDLPFVFRLNLDKKCEEEILYILRRFLLYHLEFDIELKAQEVLSAG